MTSRTPSIRYRHLIAALVAVASSAFFGCTNYYARLPREADVPTLAAATQRTIILRAESFLVETATNPGEPPFRLALHETGTGRHDRVVILLHGLLADSQTWRYLAG